MDLVERRGADAARHPWEIARAEFFLRLLAQHDLLSTGRAWLDIGSGDAWFAKQLRRHVPASAPITCWDVNYTRDDVARSAEGLELVAERPGSAADRVLMLDVVEHVEDDVAFVRGIVDELVEKDGYALASVPAYQSLFSSHDRVLRHFRRYSPGAARSLLALSGLEVVSEGGLFASLLPARAVEVGLERARRRTPRRAGVGHWRCGPTPTRLLTRALVADGRASLALSRRGVSLPGLSYWALCRPVAKP
jgi:hypothetical protein